MGLFPAFRREVFMEFESWLEDAPERLRTDPLWRSKYYQLGMYLYDLAWDDCEQISGDFRGREIARQLIRSVGSISANMEEAYSRSIGSADHSRILRISLGEAGESKGWDLRARHVLPQDVLESRLDILDQIIALLVNIIFRR
jgi:four helix bundle protein